MAKVLFIGDCHLKINKFQLSVDLLKWIESVIHNTKPDIVVNLGDVFDTHSVIRSEILNEYLEHVQRVTKAGYPLVHLLGNHEFYLPSSSKYHALKPFKNLINNFYVIDEITDLFDMTFVPYLLNDHDFPKQTKPICVAHQTFIGADYGDIKVYDGVNYEEVSADIIISGHVHKRQMYGKVIYPGTPIAHTASDIDQIKGLMIFDTETYKYEFIYSPFPIWRGLKYDLTQFPIDQMFDDMAKELDDKNYWIIDITGNKPEITSFLNDKKTKALFKNKNIKIKTSFIDKDKKMASIKAVSIEGIINEYIDNVYSGALDKEELKIKFKELI